MSDQKQPKVRFAGFDDAWEQRKLGDITSLLKDGTHGTHKDGHFAYLLSAKNIVNGEVKISKSDRMISENDFDSIQKNYQLQHDDVLLTIVGSIGRVAKYTRYDKPVTFQRSVAFLRGRSILNSEYLVYVLQTNRVQNELDAATSVSAQGGIYLGSVAKLIISLPKIKEQIRISEIFKKLDNLLAANQRQLEELKTIKKLAMQKIFDQEWRFNGFTDAWEQRKYSEMTNEFSYGLNASAKEYDGKHKYIRITDIDDSSRMFSKKHLTSPNIDFASNRDYLLHVGDVLFARTGASTGKTYMYISEDGCTYFAGFLIRGRVNSNYDINFFFQTTLTDSFKDFVKITSQRSGQPGINSKEYGNYFLHVPEKNEQIEIGKLLNKIDKLLAANQSKSEQLKKLKKWFMQNMFM